MTPAIQIHWSDLTQQQREDACEGADVARHFADLEWLHIAGWLREELIAAHSKNTDGKELIDG
jgi:hypothetical protein